MFRRAYYPLRELKRVCGSFLSYVRCIGERKQIMIILIILTVTSLGPKAIIIPGVPFSPLHLRFTLSYPTWATFLLSLKKRSAILLSAIAMTWILRWFSLPSRSATCLV